MDDHQFDDIIKRKVGEYVEPGFDPSALAALHHQMAATEMVLPWHSRYRTELMSGSCILLSAVVILCSQRIMNTESRERIENRIRGLEAQMQQLDARKSALNSVTSPDTIRMIELRDQNPLLYASLFQRIADLEASVTELTERLDHDGQGDRQATGLYQSDETYAAESNGFPALLDHRMGTSEIGQPSVRVRLPTVKLATPDNPIRLSAATIRGIEKHYRNGIGIKVGPSLEYSYGGYQMGSGKIDLTTGIEGDLIFSPSFSLETGIKYTHRSYDITNLDAFPQKTFPYTDKSLGSLEQADIDSWMFEIPVNLKYRRPISIKSHWYVGAGYSSLLYAKQVLEYAYYVDHASSASTNTSHRQKGLTSYPGLANLSLGISHQLKNRKVLETSLYYQYGLGDRGVENINGGFLGARGVYWFTLR